MRDGRCDGSEAADLSSGATRPLKARLGRAVQTLWLRGLGSAFTAPRPRPNHPSVGLPRPAGLEDRDPVVPAVVPNRAKLAEAESVLGRLRSAICLRTPGDTLPADPARDVDTGFQVTSPTRRWQGVDQVFAPGDGTRILMRDPVLQAEGDRPPVGRSEGWS
jgi:hypothetical protein